MKNFNINMAQPCLERLQKIGKRQPLPTQHFFKEAHEIISASIVEAYEAGYTDGINNNTDQKKELKIDEFSS